MFWKRSRIVYIDTRWLFLKITAAIILITASLAYWKWTRVTTIHFESTDMASSWQVSDQKIIKNVVKGLKEGFPVKSTIPGPGVVLMRLVSKREVREYLIPEPSYTYYCKNQKMMKNPQYLVDFLTQVHNELRRRSPFGEMLKWDKVRDVFPVGSRAKVQDLDSGRRFSVSRSGGYGHALVEPLTKEDSLVIRDIYSGQWSWKRRAVVVETGGRKIAASLTGMPRGSGEIKDNDCMGSVSLFFAGPTIEQSNNLAHLTMIWKAAGKTREKLAGLSPEKTLMVLFTAIDQRDLRTAGQIIEYIDETNRKNLQEVIGVTVTKIRKQSKTTYQLILRVSMRKGPYNHVRRVTINLFKDNRLGIYRTNENFLPSLLRQNS